MNVTLKRVLAPRKRNPIATDLKRPKYRMRIVKSEKLYDRKKYRITAQGAEIKRLKNRNEGDV